MSVGPLRLSLLIVLALTSLGASGIGIVEPARADDRDADPAEWEEQVAADARGDVLLEHPGTVDLLYMTMGELYSVTLRESYIFIRVGYNITEPGDEDARPPEEPLPLPPPLGPRAVPRLAPDELLTTINVTFNVSSARAVRIALYSGDFGAGWISDQGLLVADNGLVDGHKEVFYAAPFRRFGLEDGHMVSDFNVSAYRGHRLTDTMHGFEALADPLPNYPSVRGLLGVPGTVPLPVPVPPTPPPPEPIPDPADEVPDQPYPTPPAPGDGGVPGAAPTKDEARDYDPTGGDDRAESDPPVHPDRLDEDPEEARAWQVVHRISDGTGRLVARAEATLVSASFNHVGYANFTVENRFERTDQRVGLLVAGASGSRWAFRYGLDMPLGIQELPAGGRVNMSYLGVPASLFASSFVDTTAIFLSDWGGIDFASVRFLNANDRDNQQGGGSSSPLPDRLVVNLLNEDDPFRVNELRKVMVRVRTGSGHYFSGLEEVRAYVFPAGALPEGAPYDLSEKLLMDGVYEIDFVFDRPGDWIVQVYFYDYPADANGDYPNIEFQVHVDRQDKVPPILPLPAALGSLGVVMLMLVGRERLAKSR